jgi:hypothetical protein
VIPCAAWAPSKDRLRVLGGRHPLRPGTWLLRVASRYRAQRYKCTEQ